MSHLDDARDMEVLACNCQTVLVVEPVPTPYAPGSIEVDVLQLEERSNGFLATELRM